MATIPRTHEDIEAQIRDIQSRKKELVEEVNEKDRVGLGESGYYDRDIYDGGGSKFEGYVTSIAANDEVEDEDYDVVPFNQNKRPGYTAPAALLNDVAQSEKDYDPFAERRRPTIAEKEDEYRQKRRRMVISPERVDPFAQGLSHVLSLYHIARLVASCCFEDVSLPLGEERRRLAHVRIDLRCVSHLLVLRQYCKTSRVSCKYDDSSWFACYQEYDNFYLHSVGPGLSFSPITATTLAVLSLMRVLDMIPVLPPCGKTPDFGSRTYTEIMKEQLLHGEETEVC
uniref:Splicing factor 3B subunit 1 n=1 Tax=Timema poppense TaxID=170557 RepID=A0A7R9DMF2_TIMPO|nr:unnamed protein product [Timema poppensis]